jgi:hypothetical protein
VKMPSDRGDDALETRVGVDTIAVIGPTTESALQELRHQQYERSVDRDTGVITDSATYAFVTEQVGHAWLRVQGLRRAGSALLRVEVSLPTMLYAHNATAMPLDLVQDATDAALIGLSWELPDVPATELVRVNRLDLASNYRVESVDTVLRSLSGLHVAHARHHRLHIRPDGLAQTLERGSASEYMTRGYGKGRLLAEQASGTHDHAEVLRAWATVTVGLLRWELELRPRRLRREGILHVADLRPDRMEDLAVRLFRHTRYDVAYGGRDRVKMTLEELRPTLRPAVYRNLLTYLYEQEHQLNTSLGRGQIDRVRPVARRYNLVRTHAPVASVERRLDFDTGHEVAV